MRLTNSMRAAFVMAVMQDVPKIDYQAQAHKIAEEALRRYMDPRVRAVYDDPQLRPLLCGRQMYLGHRDLNYAYLHGIGEFRIEKHTTTEERSQLEVIAGLVRDQYSRLTEMQSRLKIAIQGCTTRAAAVKAMPELEKYLPAEPGRTGNLPALTNIVTDLSALGWPKEEQAA